MFASVGRGEMVSADIVKAVHPDFKEERKAGIAPDRSEAGWFGLDKAESLRFRVPGQTGDALPIRGLRGDLPVKFAPNGGAVPGDRIVGIFTPGEGITIYPIQSPALGGFDDNARWLDVRWDIDGDRKERFPAQVEVVAINEPGCLAAITSVMADLEANIEDIRVTNRAPDVRTMVVDVEVWTVKQLNAILGRLKQLPMVSQAERFYG